MYSEIHKIHLHPLVSFQRLLRTSLLIRVVYDKGGYVSIKRHSKIAGTLYFVLENYVLWASGSASLRGVGSCLYEPEASP